MKPKRLIIRTLQAMGLGLILTFALLLIGFAVETGLSSGSLDQSLESLSYAGLFGLFISLFAMGGWALVILPLTFVPGIHRLLGHLYLTEVIWILLAVLAFGLVVGTWAGTDFWLIAWIPAIVGLCVGLSYRWLGRKETLA